MKLPPAVIARILLRYGAGALIAKGVIPGEQGASILADPDVLTTLEVIVGLVMAGLAELWRTVELKAAKAAAASAEPPKEKGP